MNVRILLMITATLCGIFKTCSATNASTLYEDCLKSCIEEVCPIAKMTAQYNGGMSKWESASLESYRSFEKVVKRCAATTCTTIVESASPFECDHIDAIRVLFFDNLLDKIFIHLVDYYANTQVEEGKHEELISHHSDSKNNLRHIQE